LSSEAGGITVDTGAGAAGCSSSSTASTPTTGTVSAFAPGDGVVEGDEREFWTMFSEI
jgi:hypothetical protein